MKVPDADLAHCHAAIRQGSRSFHAASRLLPASVRDPALALYAFCRLADDAVDESADGLGAKGRAVESLRARLDAAYAGAPRNAAPDRAFARVVEAHAMPRALPDAFLEGLAWDAEGRRYASLGQLHAYGARVAGSVGVMMCVLMDVRDAGTLARACDLGLAMQLTNIARDVGSDAGAGRLYIPLDWLEAARIEPKAFLAAPRPTPEIRAMVKRLLAEARRLYRRSDAGIPALPLRARAGIYAASHIYAAIGTAVARAGHDTITTRARTGSVRKAWLLTFAAGRAGASCLRPGATLLHTATEPEAAHLVTVAAYAPSETETLGAANPWGEGRSGALLGTLAALKARDIFAETSPPAA